MLRQRFYLQLNLALTATTIAVALCCPANSQAATCPPSYGKVCGGDPTVNENLSKYVMSMGARETEFQDTGPNGQNGDSCNIIKPGDPCHNHTLANNADKYPSLEENRAQNGDYGYFQNNQNDVEHAKRLGIDPEVASCLNNRRGGRDGSCTMEEQACAQAKYLQAAHGSAAEQASAGNFSTADGMLDNKWFGVGHTNGCSEAILGNAPHGTQWEERPTQQRRQQQETNYSDQNFYQDPSQQLIDTALDIVDAVLASRRLAPTHYKGEGARIPADGTFPYP